jgi:hypothetical protein
MLIRAMPDVLTWQNGSSEVLETIYRAYLNLLCDKLSDFIGTLGASSSAASQLHQSVSEASDTALIRVLTAPETSYRLLWPAAYPRSERIHFLLNAFLAEGLKEGSKIVMKQEIWTVLGDMAFYPDGSIFKVPQVAGLANLDFCSPHTKTVELGPKNKMGEHREPFTPDEMESIFSLLENTRKCIEKTDRDLLEFSKRFNIVLIFQKDPVDPTHFSSGSTGQYVGRSFFTNPHLPMADTISCSEGIVHEGIHGLLYMQERLKPWVSWPELLESTPLIKSPWTGTILPVRQYMQACFVWYGLLHFWCLALKAQTFPPDQIRKRILTAFSGFTRGSLETHLDPYKGGVSEDLLGAISAMQEAVLSVVIEVEVA